MMRALNEFVHTARWIYSVDWACHYMARLPGRIYNCCAELCGNGEHNQVQNHGDIAVGIPVAQPIPECKIDLIGQQYPQSDADHIPLQ